MMTGAEVEPLLWGMLLHPSSSWIERKAARLACDDAVWETTTQAMADAGFTTAVISLCDSVRFDSHPDFALPDAWSPGRLREELTRLRSLGLTPVPKLNFSSVHSFWLGDYGRMISSSVYYEVAADLIAEVVELFEQPPLFHLGLDEESIYTGDPLYEYVVGRRRDLWWHDALYLIDQVASHGVRPWVWADEAWSKVGDYYDRMPTSVLQSNWFYHPDFPGRETGRPRPLDWQQRETHLAYLDLDDHGFDQVPCASTWIDPANIANTVDYCTERIAPDRLLGFLVTTWKTLVPEHLDAQLAAVAAGSAAIHRTRG